MKNYELTSDVLKKVLNKMKNYEVTSGVLKKVLNKEL